MPLPSQEPRIPPQLLALLPVKDRRTRQVDVSQLSLGLLGENQEPHPPVQPCWPGRAPWVLRDRKQLPVTTKTAAASSGQLANDTSVASVPHKCQRGLMANVP